jgi:hypothetical protein
MRIWLACSPRPFVVWQISRSALRFAGWSCAHQSTFAPHVVHTVASARRDRRHRPRRAAVAARPFRRLTICDDARTRRHFLAGSPSPLAPCRHDRWCDVDPELDAVAVLRLNAEALRERQAVS